MSSPTSSHFAIHVVPTHSQNIDALISGTKWFGITGMGTFLSYSFPWASGSALFSAPYGNDYSTLNEQKATYHFALNSTQQAAARSALQSWANVANVSFQETVDTVANVGDIRFAWTSAPSGSFWGWSYEPDSDWPSGGDVWISTLSSGAINKNWSASSYNYMSLIHEVGHALGLKHPFDPPTVLPSALDTRQYSVMSYTDPANDLFRTITYDSDGFSAQYKQVVCETPMVLDIAAIQTLYGANLTYHAGDDVYSFDKDTPFFKTIWDAGGNDTISVSNFTESCRIDLTPGNYSSIRIISAPVKDGYYFADGEDTPPTYDGTNNLGIAYGATIENATGGSGDDTLIGNSANNSLYGGAGNDALHGGAGADTAIFGGTRASHTVTRTSAGYTVSGGTNGTDTLADVEKIQFADTRAFDIALSTATKEAPVAAKGASDMATAIATQMAVVYLGRPVGSALASYFATLNGGAQPSAKALAAVEAIAIKDGAFSANDTSANIVTHTFNNIMGFLPSAYEQQAWGQYIDNGTLTKVNAPWVIFQSYLGANNVPDVYKLPTQARFVAAQTFTSYTVCTEQDASLDTLNSVYSNAARAWLSPVDSIAHAASKMNTMIADIDAVTLTGIAPPDAHHG